MIVEAICITKSYRACHFEEWLKWNLDKGFDKISVYDNESFCDIESVCKKYKEVSYQKILGIPRQYPLYDEYCKNSKADWIMPIDDDEYFWYNEEFNSVKDVIEYYSKRLEPLGMLAIRWKCLYPKIFHSQCGDSVLEYCTQENEYATSLFKKGNRGIKCLVKNDGNIHYEEVWENFSGGHVPKHSKYEYAQTIGGEKIYNVGTCKEAIENENVRLLHCRYRGLDEFIKKINTQVTISNKVHNIKYPKFTLALNNFRLK